jgi:hypothetical protein
MRYLLVAKSHVVALFAVTAGCTSTTTVEPFYRPESARVEQAYVSPTAEFRNYSRLMARPLEIYYPDDVSPPEVQDVERLRRLFREAFLRAVGQDYDIVDEPAPDVMLVTAQIVDLKILGTGGTYIPSGRLREVTARGRSGCSRAMGRIVQRFPRRQSRAELRILVFTGVSSFAGNNRNRVHFGLSHEVNDDRQRTEAPRYQRRKSLTGRAAFCDWLLGTRTSAVVRLERAALAHPWPP